MPRKTNDIKAAVNQASKRSKGIAKVAQPPGKAVPQESVSQTLIESAQVLLEEHASAPTQTLANISTLAPNDYTEVSGAAPEMGAGETQEKLAAIERQINGVKVMRKNSELTTEVEGLRSDVAKTLQARVKAATHFESVSGEVARHETQIEATRLEREKALQKALEAQGLEGLRDLISQKAQQEHAYRSAQIAKLERKTARLLNDDIEVADSAEPLPIGTDY